MAVKIPVPQDKISDFCKRHSIRKLSLFGSVLRDDFMPESDIDVLIEFEPGCTPGLEIVDIEEELSHLLSNRRVDLVNPKYLNSRIRDYVLANTEVFYEKR